MDSLTLTPELAARLLAAAGWTPTPPTHGPGHQDRVGRYADAMRAGLWRDSTITFRGGRLVDGVHRCWAVIASGVPIEVGWLDDRP